MITPFWWLQGADPPPVLLPQLTINGQFFGLETGERFTAIESTSFNAFAVFQKDGADACRPQLEQRRDVGFNLMRVFTLYDIPRIGTLLNPDYSLIPAFVSLCAEYGQYVEFVAYTSWLDPDHWPKLCAASLQCGTKPLLEFVNEYDQPANHTDPLGRQLIIDAVSTRIVANGVTTYYDRAPAPLLSSHGSNGSQQIPVEPFWSYATFHTNFASEEQRKVGHNAWEIWGGATLTNETSRCPDGGGLWAEENALQLAGDASAGAALLCAGSCFHSVLGKTFEPWAGFQLEAAQRWALGARPVPLGCQPGAYRHRDDLETPDLLRVYQRGTESRCIVRIHTANPNGAPGPMPPEPEPHRVRTTVWVTDSYQGLYGGHVVSWTDFGMLNWEWVWPDPSLWPTLIDEIHQRNRAVVIGVKRNPSDTTVTAEGLHSLDLSDPIKHLCTGILFGETSIRTVAEMSRYLQEWRGALRSRGWPDVPFKFYFQPEYYLESWGDAWKAPEIDLLGAAAYLSAVHQNDPDVKALCADRFAQQLAVVGGQRPVFGVAQAYRQNGPDGIPWANTQSLYAIQDVAYERALFDHRLVEVGAFCYVIDKRGLLDLPPEFIQLHQTWYRRFNPA